MRFPFERLVAFSRDVLVAVDVLPEHAEVTARRLLEADLRGRTGHGLIRVPQYVMRIEAGGINLRPEISVLRETPVSALVDGDNGLGQVVMTLAAETAMAKATESGMAWVGTVHSNHAGAAGVYTTMAARQDLIALYIAVASANVMPPWGGRERLLGTNPISIAIPAGEGHPFVLDIATTVTSHGSIKVLAQAGEQMPEGWVIDLEGNPILDPNRADEGLSHADRWLQGVRAQHRSRLARRGAQRRRVRGRRDRSPQSAGTGGQHRSGDVRDATRPVQRPRRISCRHGSPPGCPSRCRPTGVGSAPGGCRGRA